MIDDMPVAEHDALPAGRRRPFVREAHRVEQVRDLSVWSDGHGYVYVAACDANAGVGSREGDFLKRPPEDAGYNAAKVVLMEIYAAGARPLLILNTLCLALDDYGRRVVNGIRRALAEAGSQAPLTGSDETNMKTVQTGVGVTAIGVAREDSLMLGAARHGDIVLCAGVPRDGVVNPYEEGQGDVAAPVDVIAVASTGRAHELLPVGSKGVLYELTELAATAALDYEISSDPGVDLTASAGASTCFLICCADSDVDLITRSVALPMYRVGLLKHPD